MNLKGASREESQLQAAEDWIEASCGVPGVLVCPEQSGDGCCFSSVSGLGSILTRILNNNLTVKIFQKPFKDLEKTLKRPSKDLLPSFFFCLASKVTRLEDFNLMKGSS